MSGAGGGTDGRAAGTGFEEAWRAARPQVAGYALRALGNRADAEDVCQLVALRAWRGWATFRGDSSFLTWVMAIARREIARLAVRRQRLAAREPALPGGLDPAAPEEEPRVPGGALPLRGLADRAHARGELNPTEHAVLRARLDHPDHTWEQLGAALGLPPQRCAVAHCRAVVKLRVSLFLHHPELLGGRARLARAADRARAGPDPLTAAEETLFRRMVLDGVTTHRPRNWTGLLRSSCAKVAREISRDR
ncbi:RNA polymerase sigma factor [Kitasatospora sp. NPDC056327]|uniref:RNA polymerase sigma factor n=1 Tax=Kitasatospora sp. NPDC056327 TaxID=3345785 RepID=UPI0035D7E0AD